jgi:hypothetical protein
LLCKVGLFLTLNELCTRVSSKSIIKHFLPLSLGRGGDRRNFSFEMKKNSNKIQLNNLREKVKQNNNTKTMQINQKNKN